MTEKEYIEREAAIRAAYEAADEWDGGCSSSRDGKMAAYISNIPAADVWPVAEINEAVDEAIRILNAINSSGSMVYGDYCELHDVICAISPNCGAVM